MSSEESEIDSAVDSEEEDEEGSHKDEVELPKLELPSRATRGLRMNKVDRLAAHVQHTLSKPHE